MKSIILLLFCLNCALASFAQQGVITRDSQGGTSAAYPATVEGLEQAVQDLQSGDQLTIPGGHYAIRQNFVVSADNVTIRGAGSNRIAANNRQLTRVTGRWIYLKGQNVQLEGLNFDAVQVENDNALISRCELNYFSQTGAFGASFRECLIKANWPAKQATNHNFSNCLFLEDYNMSDCNVTNCIVIGIRLGGSGNMVTNSIFIKVPDDAPFGRNNTATNNLFVGISKDDSEHPDNYFAPNLTLADLFVNVSSIEFDLANNYHLTNAVRQQYPGSDGKPLGLYGGAMPWKEGGAPFAPRVTDNNTSNNAVGGQLQLDVTVEAQQN